ncbi:hypothetical protein MUK42_05037 [Musa troglodytarum]|uniref:DUF868 family protein n=1 Tax=Musa troglodytarum TaxID=320322 RepID=A0A9E7EQQ8_9LILI|nr:hypothetical protein MUK42_05037 [Musa troglodytarum]
MRDLAGCFASQAARVAEAACSATGDSSPVAERPTQNAVTCFYRTVLSTRKELLTRVVWSGSGHHQAAASLAVTIQDATSNAVESQLLQKTKGSRCFVAGGSVIGLHWDVSAAKYEMGPEPAKNFYVVMIADAEFALLLGDRCGELVKKDEGAPPVAEFSVVGRREQVRGATLYSTRAQFGGDGKKHDISIRCRGDELDGDDAELHVAVDRKVLVSVKRLKWNFRGNQTIFVDGSTVDVMWDVHGWRFCDSSHCALFTFRTRNSPQRRLWSEEELAQGMMSGFSLLIQAFKSR